jgi:hypothetical protein
MRSAHCAMLSRPALRRSRARHRSGPPHMAGPSPGVVRLQLALDGDRTRAASEPFIPRFPIPIPINAIPDGNGNRERFVQPARARTAAPRCVKDHADRDVRRTGTCFTAANTKMLTTLIADEASSRNLRAASHSHDHVADSVCIQQTDKLVPVGRERPHRFQGFVVGATRRPRHAPTGSRPASSGPRPRWHPRVWSSGRSFP